jgi:hypothetical protein
MTDYTPPTAKDMHDHLESLFNKKGDTMTADKVLAALIEQIDDDISSDTMSRHLKDALDDAKRYLGIDTDHEIAFKVIAEEWQIDGSSEIHTNPMTLYFYMPKSEVLSFWKHQTVWLEPEEDNNFAAILEGPYVRLAEHVNDSIWAQQAVRVIAYSHISIDKEQSE